MLGTAHATTVPNLKLVPTRRADCEKRKTGSNNNKILSIGLAKELTLTVACLSGMVRLVSRLALTPTGQQVPLPVPFAKVSGRTHLHRIGNASPCDKKSKDFSNKCYNSLSLGVISD